MVCFLNSWKQIVNTLCGNMLDWLNFRFGVIIGLIHALEKRYSQQKHTCVIALAQYISLQLK